jgi:valyl-tRNA synthetase
VEKRYDAGEVEPRLERFWEELGVYHYRRLAPPERPEHIPSSDDAGNPQAGNVYSIDTPPPTVSGFLHLGHVYSYSHADFVARFRRMNGDDVYYPMGFDDNGLPTERLVERLTGKTAEDVGRAAFIAACLETSREYEREYETLWRRLGLSIDWRYTYRTIDDFSRTTAQQTFLDLYRKDLAYRRQAPTIWCTTCHTAIAQAEEKDLDRRSEFVTLPFLVEDGAILPIATTRPELLAACVAVFVHPATRAISTWSGIKRRFRCFITACRSSKTNTPTPRRAPELSCAAPSATPSTWSGGTRTTCRCARPSTAAAGSRKSPATSRE